MPSDVDLLPFSDFPVEGGGFKADATKKFSPNSEETKLVCDGLQKAACDPCEVTDSHRRCLSCLL